MDTVKEIRRRKGWSQKDLAEESGIGQDTISGIESGRHEPRPSTLRKLADALDVEVADFFREPAVPLAEAPREAGPPQVSRKELLAQGITVSDLELEELNDTLMSLWRLGQGEKVVARIGHEVDTDRIFMLVHLVLDTPGVVRPEAAGVLNQGMRERLKA